MVFRYEDWKECLVLRLVKILKRGKRWGSVLNVSHLFFIFFSFDVFFLSPASVNIKAPYLWVMSFLISPSALLYATASSSVYGSAKVMASTKPAKAARIRPFISETCLLLPNEKPQMIHLYTFELRRGRACLTENVSTYQDIDLPRQCYFLYHVPALVYL